VLRINIKNRQGCDFYQMVMLFVPQLKTELTRDMQHKIICYANIKLVVV